MESLGKDSGVSFYWTTAEEPIGLKCILDKNWTNFLRSGFKISWGSSHDHCPTVENTKETWGGIIGLPWQRIKSSLVKTLDNTYCHHSPTSLWLGLRKMCSAEMEPPIALAVWAAVRLHGPSKVRPPLSSIHPASRLSSPPREARVPPREAPPPRGLSSRQCLVAANPFQAPLLRPGPLAFFKAVGHYNIPPT